MNTATDLPSIVRTAVQLNNFDTRAARLVMSPIGRTPERPAGLAGTARSGAVLSVIFAAANGLNVILIKRRDDLRHHPGQISFPGGRREQDEPPLECALRETREEIGIEAETLSIAGALDPAYILVSDFCIHPFVAWHQGAPTCSPDPWEVDAILQVPLARLCEPGARVRQSKPILGTLREVPGFLFAGHHIWGATAVLLNEIIERLKAVGWKG